MSEKYLLPCSCGQKVSVERRQAGSSVICSCGKELEIPTIRNFAHLEKVESETESLPPLWGLRQGLVFLGLVIALPALAYAGYVYSQLNTLETDFLQIVGQSTMDFTPAQSVMLWNMYKDGMPKAPTPYSARIVEAIQSLKRTIGIAGVIAIVGLLIAASGFLVKSAPAGKRPQSPSVAKK
jgi:hypothetical protein